MSKTPLLPNEVITSEVRFSYVNLVEAKAINNVGAPQYSAKILIRKDDAKTKEALGKARDAARQNGVTEGKKPFATMSPQKLATMNISIKDGDVDFPDNPECAGCLVINAKTPADKPPGILVDYPDGAREKPRTPTDIYSGMYGIAHLQLYPYDTAGNAGIGISLQNVLKTKDGDPLGGSRKRAEDVFGVPDSPFGTETAAPVGSPI